MYRCIIAVGMVRRCMRFFLGFVLTSAIYSIGCGDSVDHSPPTPGPPVSDVKGTLVDIHVTESGDVPATLAPSQFEVAAVFPGDDGKPREILAVIDKSGMFVISNVPEVPYDLRFVEFYGAGTLPPRYIMNAPRNIDLGRVYVGRPDAELVETNPSEIALTATGLEPWSDGDTLELFSLGSGSAGPLVPTGGTYPAAGATSLSDYRVDTSRLLNATLVNGGKGDTAVITQLAGTAHPTAPYHSVRKVFEAPSFTQTDGTLANVSGAFSDVIQEQLPIDISASEFNAFAGAVHKAATVSGKNIRIIAEPGGERATTSMTPTLLLCEALPSATLPASFSYGNPFPPAWAEVVSADVSFVMTHTAPTGISKSTAVTIGQSGPVGSFATPVVPLIGPPLDIKINDMPAHDTLTGIGFSPTITFSPPSVGTPAAYIVAIRRLDPGGSTTRTMAIFSTTEPMLRIPEGLLDFGYYYYFRISVRANFDIAQPFKSSTTNAYASALTGVLTP